MFSVLQDGPLPSDRKPGDQLVTEQAQQDYLRDCRGDMPRDSIGGTVSSCDTLRLAPTFRYRCQHVQQDPCNNVSRLFKCLLRLLFMALDGGPVKNELQEKTSDQGIDAGSDDSNRSPSAHCIFFLQV